MNLRTTLLTAAAALAITPAAHAGDGLYGAIGAGLSYFGYENDVSTDSVANPGPTIFDSDSDYDNGIGIYLALGKKLDSGFRTELEYSYRTADIDQIDPNSGFRAFHRGQFRATPKFMLLWSTHSMISITS